MATNIYVLKLEEGFWYIGRTGNVERRLQQHKSGNASAWTRLHKPLRLEVVMEDMDMFDEDKYTKLYMAKYGIDKVRGGSYVTAVLNKHQIFLLQREIWGAQDVCFVCGGAHFVRYCKIRESDSDSESVGCCGRVWGWVQQAFGLEKNNM